MREGIVVEIKREFSTFLLPRLVKYSTMTCDGYITNTDKHIVYSFDWLDQPGLQAFLEEVVKSKGDGDYVGFRGIGVRMRRINRSDQLIWWFQKKMNKGEYEYERADSDTFIPAEWYCMNPEGVREVVEKAKEFGENGDVIEFEGLTVKLKTDQHASPYIPFRNLIFVPQAVEDSETSA